MPAEWNHKEKCNFTWKVEVLTWESCDGFCKGKQKFRIREGDITGKATVHISTDLQHPKRAGVWLCPTDLGVVWGASQLHTGRNPVLVKNGPGAESFDLDTDFSEKSVLGWGSFGFSWFAWVIWRQSGPIMKLWISLKFPRTVWFLSRLWHHYSHGNCVISEYPCHVPLHLTVPINKGSDFFFFQDTLNK